MAASRTPRDAQRRRVYLAETPLPSSPLPGLPACERYVDRVVGTLWWAQRFPDRTLGNVPRLRPGNGARQAFYREDPGRPSITLPRRYRTKAVVLHELTHWALAAHSDLPPHGRTFARVLLDAVSEFLGDERAAALAASYREHKVHVARPPRRGPDGRLRYGWDERLRLTRGHAVTVRYTSADGDPYRGVTGVYEGPERRSTVLRLRVRADEDPVLVPTASVWDVRRVGSGL
ncbi:MAG: hypothetical protein U0V73_15905 [Acidimicrobiia bacterium]